MAALKINRPVRNICASCMRHEHATSRRAYSASSLRLNEHSALPRVAQPSFWASMIPKPLRRASPEQQEITINQHKPRSRFLTRPRDWNPYTIFIILAMVAGSNAMQLLALRNETLNYTRQTEAKLSALREVLQRVKAGEDVDVRKALGTGDEKSEREWEEVMRELETADTIKEGWAKREAKKRAKQDAARAREGGGGNQDGADDSRDETSTTKEAEPVRPRFMM